MTRATFKGDLAGTIVVALASIPQAFAHGLIATAPLGPEWAAFGIASSVGTAIVFGLIAGPFGSNKNLISGSCALTALIVAAAVHTAVGRGHTAETALTLAYAGVGLAGIFKLIAGLTRLGGVMAFMPSPVLLGFVNASALLIVLASLPLTLGLSDLHTPSILNIHWQDVSIWAVAVGLVTICANLLTENRFRIMPAALFGLMVGIAFYHAGVAFADLPQGPEVGFFNLTSLSQTAVLLLKPPPIDIFFTNWDIVLLAGLSIGLLAAFDTVFGGAAMDAQSGEKSSTDKDLVVQGIGNVLMGLLGFLPGSGSLMRAKAAYRAGSRSRFATYASGIAIAIMLSVLAPVISRLPIWAAGGMIITIGLLSIDRTTVSRLLDVLLNRGDYPRVMAGDVFVTFMVVFTALAADLIVAVGVGVVLAVTLFVVGMGRDPVRRSYQCKRVRSTVQRTPDQIKILEREGHRIGVIELKGALFFGSHNALSTQAEAMLDSGTQYLIIDLRHLTSLDSTGAETLRKLATRCAEAGGGLLLSSIEPERRSNAQQPLGMPPDGRERRVAPGRVPRLVWLMLHKNRVLSQVGTDCLLDTVDGALAKCEEVLLQEQGRTGKIMKQGIISNSPLLASLSRAEICRLGRYAKRKSFDTGAAIFAQHDHGDSAYFLVTGRVDVSISIPGSSRKRSLTVLTEGALFGEMALLDGGPRSANVTASERSTCFVLHQTDFKQLEKDNPELVLILMKNLNSLISDRLRIANTMISELEQ